MRITDITDDGKINKSGLKSVNDERANLYILKPNDIVFARTGASTGRNYFYDGQDGVFVYAGFLIKFSLDPQKVNPKYIKYYCMSDKYKNWIRAFSSGSTRDNINAKTLGDMLIPLPPRSQQNNLVSILSLLDDKIEINNRINENLLQQAICFYSALIDGKPKNGCIGDYCSIKSGFAFKSQWWQDSGVPVVKISSINQDNLNLSECSFVSEDKIPLAKDFIVTGGDIIIAMTGIIKFTMIPKTSQTILVNQRVGKFFLGNNPVARVPFIYCTLKQYDIISEIINRTQGSVQPNISASDIMSVPCVMPPLKDIENFNASISPMFEMILNNQYENQKLSQIRDSLLPKLISGQLDISNLDI